MSFILCIETATEVCSVALVSETKVLSICENNDGTAHASRLTILIDEAIRQAGISLKQLDAIAVSKGPGSYTGLRVGVSTAKGLCYALEKPMISVETLKAMATGFIQSLQDPISNDYFVPMIDARRMEVYAAVFNASLDQ